MPVGELAPYLEHLPALQAEQALDRIAQHAAGAGTMEEQAHKSFIRELRRAANRGRSRVEKATVASLAAMRIVVETVGPSEEGKQNAGTPGKRRARHKR